MTTEAGPNQLPQGRDILQLIDALAPAAADPLAYDETVPERDTVARVGVGITWELPDEDLRPDESVRIAVCNEDGRYRLGELLRSSYSIEALPMAFIEFKIDKEGASFSSCSYVLETGEVAAVVDTAMDEDAVLTEDSQDCFEFAEQLGLGGVWTRAMFAAEQPGTNTTNELLLLDESQTAQLYNFLNTLADRV